MMNYRHWTIAATLAIVGTVALFGCAKPSGTTAVDSGSTTSTTAQNDDSSSSMSGDNSGATSGEMSDARSKDVKGAVATLAAAKKDAINNGTYDCCLKHACSQCMLMIGSCPCGKSVEDGMPVCQECKGGWDAGDGDVPGKKAADIKVLPRGGM